jgi:hypothetical protein
MPPARSFDSSGGSSAIRNEARRASGLEPVLQDLLKHGALDPNPPAQSDGRKRASINPVANRLLAQLEDHCNLADGEHLIGQGREILSVPGRLSPGNSASWQRRPVHDDDSLPCEDPAVTVPIWKTGSQAWLSLPEFLA